MISTNHPITGKTLGKFPDIVQAGLIIKLAQVQTNARFGFLSAQVAQKIEELIISAQKHLPPALCSLEMWSNDFSVLNTRINQWIAAEANVDISEVSLLDSNAAFSQTIESLVITARLKSAIDGNRELINALRSKAQEFENEIRLTRVHVCESTPGTWAQVFQALADSVEHALDRIESDKKSFVTVLAGSIFQDDLKAPREYAQATVEAIEKLTGQTYHCPSREAVEITDILMGSSRLMELCSDLHILSMVYQRFVHGFFIYGSGPRAGLAEIALPAIAPGSTIMPGKINPSMAMLLEQACQNLSAIDQMAQYSYNEYDFDQSWQSAGAFLMAAEALELLGKAGHLFVEKCLTGFSVQSENNRRHVENALFLARIVGLLKGKVVENQIRSLMQTKNVTVKEACIELGVMTSSEVDTVFDTMTLAQSGISLQTLNRYLKKF